MDTIVILLALFGAVAMTNRSEIADLEQFLALRVTIKNVLLLVVFLMLWQAVLVATGRRSMWVHWGRHGELAQVSAACTIAALAAAAASIAGLSTSFGAAAVIIFWLCSVPSVLLSRVMVRAAARSVTGATRARQLIIVGSGPRAHAAYRCTRDNPETGYNVLGFVDSNRTIGIPEIRDRHLGELGDLESILMHRHVDLVLIALPVKSQYSRIQEVIQLCERVGVESRYLADIFDRQIARQEFESDDVMPSVAMKVVHDDARTVVKRVIDVAAASVGLALLLPLFVATSVAIRMSGPGPVLFSQERYGLNRRIFRMYKFRTMVTNAEALQFSLEHLNEAGGPVFKIRNDPRVTRLGRFLRRTSLDELPQLFNVLKGDMSLVGPRPLPLRDVRHFSEAALMRRFSVLPGLTCLWQVSGRSNLSFDDWIRLDLRYIDGWSLSLDLKILLRTIPAVLRGAGAS